MNSATVRELAKNVSSYFLTFLETDFKKQQAPGRRISIQKESGLKVGTPLSRYPHLAKALWVALDSPVSSFTPITVGSRGYMSPLTSSTKETVEKAITLIPESTYESIRADVIAFVEATAPQDDGSPEEWISRVESRFLELLSERIVRPILKVLDSTLRRQAQFADEATYNVEIDVLELLARSTADELPNALASCTIAADRTGVREVMNDLFTKVQSSNILREYFEGFGTSDAYVDLRQLWTSMRSKENQELYLYIGALSFKDNRYPLFYVPLTIEMEEATAKFKMSLKPQVLVYKRAIDYILQEVNTSKVSGPSPVSERIIYAAGESTLASAFEIPLANILAALRLDPEYHLSCSQTQKAESPRFSLDSSLHLAVYDKSDESLLNDYEALLAAARGEGDQVLNLFEGLVKSIILDDPKSCEEQIAAKWDETGVADRLVHESPIPLNEEQYKILSALRTKDCRFLVVEGPPGTGKSHTISAIAFDAILSGKNVLLLSDKKEALDVVENKLVQTLASVRHSDDFPNPILRLGQDSTNFRRLVSGSTVSQVSDYHKAAVARGPELQAELKSGTEYLKAALTTTVSAATNIDLNHIKQMHRLESELDALIPDLTSSIRSALEDNDGVNLPECLARFREDSVSTLAELLEQFSEASLADINSTLEVYTFTRGLVPSVNLTALKRFQRLLEKDVEAITLAINEYESLRRPVIGYLFRKSAITALSQRLNMAIVASPPIELPADLALLRTVATNYAFLKSMCAAKTPAVNLSELLQILFASDAGEATAALARPLHEFSSLWRGKEPRSLRYTANGEQTNLEYSSILLKLIRYGASFQANKKAFAKIPEIDYIGSTTRLEQLQTTRMTQAIDGRFLTFVRDHKAEAKSLGMVIRAHQKFPEERFDLVRSAFPVIIASIREFAEYMPLLPELFDVVVIDEASQVSVAQAFPAILRAKKLVVLGDKKQFANVKASNASNDLNNQCRADLEQLFRKKISTDAGRLQRLSMFDVKRSVLEFVEMCSNYNTMLRKHFRGYLELISFSSKYFYNGQLQAVKIRGCPIEDVIRFSQVEAEAEHDNTNAAEGKFILAELRRLLERENPPTVGIITPFRAQQVHLQKMFEADERGAEFERRLKLKVMTFDSCQGEERQIIFYSLVASPHSDKLNWIFPRELDSADEHVEEKLRMQRLNVGFSRAQETIWFVLSKPVDQYGGSIARVLQHYRGLLATKSLPQDGEVDTSSPMERELLGWLKATRLIQIHGEAVELIAQFPIGEYLRQLDPTYTHPAWRVDFLLRVPTKGKKAVQIIVEYDGFEYHFSDRAAVHAGNFERYMTGSDVERQKTLESYGYKFLRVNRFNIGKDPVKTLSDRLEKLIDLASVEVRSDAVKRITQAAEGLQDKSMRSCSKCGQVKPMNAFFDKTLAQGAGAYGRKCIQCKRTNSYAYR